VKFLSLIPKEKKIKTIYLLPEDVDLIKTLPRGMPQLYFFRHRQGIKGVKADKRFGEHLFYTTWKKACDNLGVKDVDLYGGTRHSTAKHLRNFRTLKRLDLQQCIVQIKRLNVTFKWKEIISVISTKTLKECNYKPDGRIENFILPSIKKIEASGKEVAKVFKDF